jgi:hypothetical protein
MQSARAGAGMQLTPAMAGLFPDVFRSLVREYCQYRPVAKLGIVSW